MTVAVRRLQVSACGGAPAEVAALVRAAHLGSGGIPPAATLVVRRLRDPLPGTLCADGTRPIPSASWERAAAAALESHARRARRPAREPVGDDAEAVLFADGAELLACLSLAWLDGTGPGRWWWRALVDDGDSLRAFRAHWLRAPEHAPAALDLLAAADAATDLVGALSDPDAEALLARIVQAFALPVAGSDLERASAPAAAPWGAIAPEASSVDLTLAGRRLLGTALVLRRSPQTARRPEFSHAAERWRAEAAEDGPPLLHAARAPARAAPPAWRRPSGRPDETSTGAGSPDDPGAPAPITRARAHRLQAPPPPPPRGPTRGVGAEVSAPPRVPTAEPGGASAPSPTRLAEVDLRGVAERRRDGEPRRAEPPPFVAAVGPSPGAPIETGLGGVFYLANLGLFLELYGDFSTPSEPGIGLDPWDFVSLLGRYLLWGPRDDDPVWRLIAGLAGRPDGAPAGAGFAPPATWRVPPAWLTAIDQEGPLRWEAARGRLRIGHPAGFLLVDVPLASDPAGQLASELARYGPPAAHPAPVGGPPARRTALAWWVARIGAYARARLGRALGVRTRPALSRRLLEHRARVHVAPAHVDVVLSLSELPIEVRIAGLDRTPGWIPAAGRRLAFHFE
jgi:hypothetical protein